MVLVAVLTCAAALPVALILWTAVALFQNYVKATSTGLQVSVRFITPSGPLWMMFSPLIIPLCEYFPFTETSISLYRRGWEARERYLPHAAMGDLFIICAPGGNWLKVCNDAVAQDVFKRRDEFGRDMEAFEVLNIYGKNLATTEGADWNRHRKVAAVTFTERNNELVWRESLKEGMEMLEYWLHRSPQPIRTLAQDARIFTLNVLAAALFDQTYPFESREESELREKNGKRDKAFEYRDSISTILRMIVPILVFGEKKLRDAWWLPFPSLRKAGKSVSDFRTYVTELINEERMAISQGKRSSPNLVTNLVRACEEESDGSLQQASYKPNRAILSKDEIISDLFVFAFAGNDTTAITLTFLLAELAAHPEVQEWISEEILHYFSHTDVSQWSYSTSFKLKRCWAVMYETLRLNHPLGQLVKTTGTQPKVLHYQGRDIIVPAHTTIEINLPGLSTHPRYWGPDSLIWNPKRFVTGTSIESEALSPDITETFFPWAFGRAVCPGKRFSQVELVAVVATLFRHYVLEPVLEKGETMDQARARVGKAAEDIELKLLNEMRAPETVAVKWVKRV